MRDNWEVGKLEIFVDKIIGGGTPPRNIESYWNGSIPWASVKDFEDGKNIIKDTEEKITLTGIRNSSSNLIPSGIPILCTRMAVGRVATSPKDIAINQDLKALFPSDNIENDFFIRVLNHLRPEFEKKAIGSTVKGISLKDLKSVMVKIPKAKNHQRKIAQILSTCDAVIEKTEAAIAKYQAIKQGMMHDLFTRGILMEDITYTDKNGKVVERSRNQLRPKQEDAPELYKESELGWIPKEWEVELIINSTYLKGRIGWQGLRADEFIEHGPYLVTGTDFKDGKIEWSKCYHVSEERFNEAKYIQLQNDDFLITKDGTIGKTAYVENCPKRAVLNSGIFLMRCKNDSYVNRYVFHLLNSTVFDKYLFKTLGGSTIIHLYQREFEKFPFPLPSKNEQFSIIKRIDTLLEQIQAEQSTLSKYRQIKAGLMQDLLSGKVEVNVDGVEYDSNIITKENTYE